jgi:hypothetical protein
MHMGLWLKDLKERDHVEDQHIGWSTIFEWILQK